jgi:hypothetical protein
VAVRHACHGYQADRSGVRLQYDEKEAVGDALKPHDPVDLDHQNLQIPKSSKTYDRGRAEVHVKVKGMSAPEEKNMTGGSEKAAKCANTMPAQSISNSGESSA